MSRARGFLISVEGIDGTGKTTQVELLKAWFERMGRSAVSLKEPTNGQYGNEIARLAATEGMDVKMELQSVHARPAGRCKGAHRACA